MRDNKETEQYVLDRVYMAINEIELAMERMENVDRFEYAPEVSDLDYYHDKLSDYANELEGRIHGVATVEDWE